MTKYRDMVRVRSYVAKGTGRARRRRMAISVRMAEAILNSDMARAAAEEAVLDLLLEGTAYVWSYWKHEVDDHVDEAVRHPASDPA